jgi:hypothetical protein
VGEAGRGSSRRREVLDDVDDVTETGSDWLASGGSCCY